MRATVPEKAAFNNLANPQLRIIRQDVLVHTSSSRVPSPHPPPPLPSPSGGIKSIFLPPKNRLHLLTPTQTPRGGGRDGLSKSSKAQRRRRRI